MSKASRAELENLRMMTKVAQLYHSKSMVQADIAKSLGLSQARVSRLLSAAEENGIVKKIVVPPTGIFSDVERAIESRFGLSQVHIVDGGGEPEEDLKESLGTALTAIFDVFPIEGKIIGLTSWSKSLRSFVSSIESSNRAKARYIVEMLGGVGDPALQHKATNATEWLAKLTGATPLFLRVPGVVSSPLMKKALLEIDSHAQSALDAFDQLDIALVGIGTSQPAESYRNGSNFFTDEQFQAARESGAVGEINLRFIDAGGVEVNLDFDDNVIGIELDRLKKVPLRVGVAGGKSKHKAILAACRGGWINVLVTDTITASFLLDEK